MKNQLTEYCMKPEVAKGRTPTQVRLPPTDRIQAARICQGGASNERKVAQCLVEAIDQCREAQIDPRRDAATYLILHQLAFLLTGHDIQPHTDMGKTWLDCFYEVRA